MHMHIHETGKNSAMMEVNDGSAGKTAQPFCNGNNTSVRNGKVNRAEPPVRKQHGVFQKIV